MKKISLGWTLIVLWSLFLIAYAIFMLWPIPRYEAQAQSGTWSFSVSSPHASCPAVTAATTQFCYASDGLWQSLNGAAWQQIGSQPIAINGKTGTSFTLSVTTQPTATVTAQSSMAVVAQ